MSVTGKKLHLETCCVPIDLKKELDTDFMISLLLNLVDNACKASETGGRIFIAASAGQIVVEDFGKGIPSEELHHVTEAFSSELVLGLRLGYSGAPQKKDMRNLNAVPITYTAVSGGAKMGMENDTVRWGYETLDIYITKDGIDEICFANQYDIGSPDTNKIELLPFSDIMAVFDKMMQVQNAALFIDKSADEGDYGTPPQAVNYHIDKITLGYMRIYDPYSGKREGKLVPVWDFYGSCTISYDEITPKSFRDANKSVLTVNAIDGTVVDRWLGF